MLLINTLFTIKIIFTLFTFILIPVYMRNYGIQNFLWLSDIGLFLTIGALWLESPLLISIAAISMLPFEIIWNIDFFVYLLTGYKVIGIAYYMFEAHYTLFLRALSLFHIVLPLFWLWLLALWGYDQYALYYAVPLIWIVLILSYTITDPQANINWVFLPTAKNWQLISPLSWLIIMLIVLPFIFLWPMHELLKRVF